MACWQRVSVEEKVKRYFSENLCFIYSVMNIIQLLHVIQSSYTVKDINSMFESLPTNIQRHKLSQKKLFLYLLQQNLK